MRIIVIFTLTAIIILSSCGSAYAQSSDIGKSQIHPAHPFYFLKAVRENIEMHFAQTPNVKMLRQLEFATRRIREVKSLVTKNREDLIPPTMERYWFHMNTVLQYRPREVWLTLLLNYTISTHQNALEELYEKIGDRRAKMSIRTAIFRILDGSDIPAEERVKRCEFLSKEATSSALTEVERAILRSRAEKCFKH